MDLLNDGIANRIGLINSEPWTVNLLQAISKPPLRPNLGVGMRRPILKIADYYCGCPPRSALILDPIEGFEMACSLDILHLILSEILWIEVFKYILPFFPFFGFIIRLGLKINLF